MLLFHYQGRDFQGYRVVRLCNFLLLDNFYDLYIPK
jgi:hypothetical protein